MSFGVVTRHVVKRGADPGVVTRLNVCPERKVVGPGGTVLGPPPILPIRKSTI